MYSKGTRMLWLYNGLPAYEKIDNEDWGHWHSLEYDLDKPLDKRYGWRWTDQQVCDYFKSFMQFTQPLNN